ncbi:MAG: trypsin-like peptidase domain-containing protein [Bacteroidales bacterium]|nr:trypsin-like peptidase domain-containing protein [Bacteroidales bacterium]
MDKREDWPISGINIAVSRIEIRDKDKSSYGGATGFFFKYNENKYLITNRHVVIDESEDFYPQFLRLRLHTSKINYEENCIIDISLYNNALRNWLEHSDYKEKKIDVVAVPLTNDSINNFNSFNSSKINFFTTDNFISGYHLSSFADVIIIGYPLGFFDEINNLPIYRKGMIASSYPVDFKKFPYFLIDANLHKGTSGSPVLSSPNNMLIDSKGRGLHSDKSVLLGIHSAEHIIEDEPLGLNVVWYPKAIIDIIGGK